MLQYAFAMEDRRIIHLENNNTTLTRVIDRIEYVMELEHSLFTLHAQVACMLHTRYLYVAVRYMYVSTMLYVH